MDDEPKTNEGSCSVEPSKKGRRIAGKIVRIGLRVIARTTLFVVVVAMVVVVFALCFGPRIRIPISGHPVPVAISGPTKTDNVIDVATKDCGADIAGDE